MKRWIPVAVAACTLAFFVRSQQRTAVPRPAAAAPAAHTALRVTFGEKQERETDYSGALSLSDGRVAEIIPWRFFGDDQLQVGNGRKLGTRRENSETQPKKPIPLSTPGTAQNIVPKGITDRKSTRLNSSHLGIS